MNLSRCVRSAGFVRAGKPTALAGIAVNVLRTGSAGTVKPFFKNLSFLRVRTAGGRRSR
jgi:hypothetical protein